MTAEYVLQVAASPAQRRLWSMEADAESAAVHNINVEITRPGPLEADALRAALADLCDRHEALRTSFRLADGTLWQRVHAPGVVIPVEFADLTGSSPEAADSGYREIRQRTASRPFDLADAPLIRLAQVRRNLTGQPGLSDTLVLVLHHAVADARSAHVVLGDLMEAYRARAAGTAPQWQPVMIQYADFSAWLEEQARDPQADLDLAYWREHLSGLEELDLTYGRPRPATPSAYGGSIAVQIGPELTTKIGELARAEHATPFMVMVAAYATALGRVFGGADVAVGTSLSTRTLPEVEQTVGLFVDRIVLRLDLAGRPGLRELVRRARAEVVAAQDHGQVGYDRIVGALAPPRRYGVEPLAQASINLQPALLASLGEDDPADGQFGNGTVRHDLALDLAELTRTYQGNLEFRDGVVTAEAARRVAAVFSGVLHAGTADPDRPVAHVSAVDAAELGRLHASQDGGPPGSVDGARSVLELVDRWVARTPAAVAVDASDGRLSYRDLAAQAAAIAIRLREHGVAEQESVLVALPRVAALPAAVLGVMAAGACYVPVDPTAPAAHLATVARTVAARVALVMPGSQAPLPQHLAVMPVDVAAGPPGASAPSASLASHVLHQGAVAYVLFTSGSTGSPKGVAVEHYNLVSYVGALLDLVSPQPGAVHALLQSPTFDSSLGTIFGALTSGGILRLLSEDAARDPALLAALLTDAPADYLKITPSHLAALLSHAGDQWLRPRRALVLGGERAHHGLVQRLVRAGWTVYGHYGPTETTIGVLAGPLGEHTGTPSQTVPLGGPLPGVRVYVLDESGVPVPPGCRGELCVGGALVSRGYVGMPGATAAAYLPDPFALEPGARMYRTGDLVRRLDGQAFEFCGRLDRQMKVRGHRIEPGEIEAALAAIPGVSQAVVVRQEGPGQERLVGYIVPEADRTLIPQRLHAELLEKLPAHLVPDALMVLDRLPMSPSGKLDPAALPKPQPALMETGDFLPPATPHEVLLAEVFQAVLGLDRVSVTAGFFEAGGDSITAIGVVTQARARGMHLTTRDLFEHHTIRRLAAIAAADRTEPLPAGPVRAGLGGAVAPVVVRLAVPDTAAARAALTGPDAPEDWTCQDGVRLRWQEAEAELTADPASCDDRSLAWIASFLAASGTAGSKQAAVTQARAEGGALAAVIRLTLTADVARALAEFPGRDSSVHDTYGTRPLDLAVAAVFDALGTGAQATGPAVLIADCTAWLTPSALGQHAMPGVARFTGPAAQDRPDPADLLRIAKTAVHAARDSAASWMVAALADQTEMPGTVLRLLPLPPGALLADPGTGGPSGPLAGRTVVVLAGEELLVCPAGPDDVTGSATRFAERIRAALELLVGHCKADKPVYRPSDFPDAHLDDATLARLLDRIGGGS